MLRDGEVPAWSAVKVSPHQTGFNDILALAQLRGEAPEAITLIGVQPEELSDLGGSLRDGVKARIPEAVELAASELAAWGFRRGCVEPALRVVPLNSAALALDAYESGRPSSEEACRIGDARVLARTRDVADDAEPCASASPCRSSSIGDGRPWCEGRGRRQQLDTMLIGDAPPGTWVLAFQGSALRVITADEAAQTNDALDALEAVLAGAANLDAYFADLVERDRAATTPAEGSNR